MKRYLLMSAAIIFFCLMLLFPAPVVAGASKGILLWFQVVLPTLLPFIIVSNLLIETRAINVIAKITGHLFSRFFRVSSYGSFAILTGFLCGYPMGSKVTADLIRNGSISTEEGRYLLSFCNNTSPMFIISYVLIQNLGDKMLFIPSLVILMGTPVICSFIFRFLLLTSSGISGRTPTFSSSSTLKKKTQNTFAPSGNIIDCCIMNGFETITKVGGYIMLFAIIIELCHLLPASHPLFYNILFPSLEITTGIQYICSGTLPQHIRFILCLSMTSFGGWCAVAQTQCMIQGTGLSIFPYIIQKLITAGVTSLFAYLYIGLK